jgi:hypothetical protein
LSLKVQVGIDLGVKGLWPWKIKYINDFHKHPSKYMLSWDAVFEFITCRTTWHHVMTYSRPITAPEDSAREAGTGALCSSAPLKIGVIGVEKWTAAARRVQAGVAVRHGHLHHGV